MDIIARLAVGTIVCLLIGLLSYRKKLVDKSGLIAGMIVGVGIFTLGGWKLYVLILTFHLTAGFFTHYKYKEKLRRGVAEFKGGARRWSNVFANGLIPLVSASLEFMSKKEIYLIAYMGSVSAGLSDTLSNEIGVLNPSPPRLITKLKKKVPPGTPGGVSPLGILTSFLSPLLIGILAVLLNVARPEHIPIIMSAGAAGSIIDSIVGGSIQAIYRCTQCGKLTEREFHCGKKAILVRGSAKVNNHVVNLIMSVSGASVSTLLWQLFT